jgi:hypothetical protein
MGTQGPPTLGTFNLRQQLWQRLGMKLDELQELPWREAEDYVLYIQLISREEEARSKQASAKRAGR